MADNLTPEQRAYYIRCKALFTPDNVRKFLRITEALTQIRDHKLYLEGGYNTFEECCRDEFNFDPDFVNQIIGMVNCVDPPNPN